MKVKRYRRKPLVLEAVHYTPDTDKEALLKWLGRDGYFREDGTLVIRTLEGDMIAPLGYYIVKGVKGEAYPVSPEVFTQIYEPIEDGDA